MKNKKTTKTQNPNKQKIKIKKRKKRKRKIKLGCADRRKSRGKCFHPKFTAKLSAVVVGPREDVTLEGERKSP